MLQHNNLGVKWIFHRKKSEYQLLGSKAVIWRNWPRNSCTWQFLWTMWWSNASSPCCKICRQSRELEHWCPRLVCWNLQHYRRKDKNACTADCSVVQEDQGFLFPHFHLDQHTRQARQCSCSSYALENSSRYVWLGEIVREKWEFERWGPLSLLDTRVLGGIGKRSLRAHFHLFNS